MADRLPISDICEDRIAPFANLARAEFQPKFWDGFGVFGNVPAAALCWMTVVGWEAVNLVIATFALCQLAVTIHIPPGNVTKAVGLALIMLVTFIVTVWDHQTIVVLQLWFSVAQGPSR